MCVHAERDAIDAELAAGAKYRTVSNRYAVTTAAVGRHARAHLPLHLARAEDASEAASAAAILERLLDRELILSRLFHGAAADGSVTAACMTVRELTRVSELLAKVADAIPHPPTAPTQSLFVWPDGRTLPVVPLESEAELAAAGGHVSPAHATPAPVAPAADAPDDFVPFDEADDPEEP